MNQKNKTMECENCIMVFVKKTKSNGGFIVNKQCFNCGKIDSKAYKFSLIGSESDVNNLPNINKTLNDLYYENKRNEIKKEYLSKRQERLNQLNIYYQSEKWKQKRIKVLERDGYICKACETNKATQVHHKSYEFFSNEPLFDLVSVCAPCHEKIERLKKENNKFLS